MTEKQQYKELKRNTLIIAISNLGSKAISFILAPMYSYYLSTSEYGQMDLITTTAGLLFPLLCLDIFEAAFRFASDKDHDEKTVFSSSISLSLIISILAVLIVTGVGAFVKLPPLVSISVIVAAIDATYYVLSQFARGRGKMRVFAFSGVLNSLLVFGLNLLLLVALRYGLTGWVIGFVAAKAIACIYILFAIHASKLFSVRHISKAFYKEALKYCLPLLPTQSMWWVMNASDRYMVALFMGTAANGIYAVANKLPTLLSVFENIFYQAWQTSAINALDDEHRNKFYSDVFRNYLIFLTLGVMGLLIILKPFTILLFASEYRDAWMCSSILVVGVMFHALGGNLGTIYVTFKKTQGALITAIIGAMTNIILNYFLIPVWGITAAATTTVIGYIVVLLYRWFDVKKYVKLQVSMRMIATTLALIIVQFTLYYVPGIISYVARAILFMGYAFMNRELILKMVKRK